MRLKVTTFMDNWVVTDDGNCDALPQSKRRYLTNIVWDTILLYYHVVVETPERTDAQLYWYVAIALWNPLGWRRPGVSSLVCVLHCWQQGVLLSRCDSLLRHPPWSTLLEWPWLVWQCGLAGWSGLRLTPLTPILTHLYQGLLSTVHALSLETAPYDVCGL